MSKRRLFVLVIMALAVFGLFNKPSSARGAQVAGLDSPGCVETHDLFGLASTSGWSRIDITFHLKIESTYTGLTVMGHWVSNVGTHGGQTWAGPTDKTVGPISWMIGTNETSGLFRVVVPAYYAGLECFTVDHVVVTLWPTIPQPSPDPTTYPATPSPIPVGTPCVSVSGSGPCGSPAPGTCWMPDGTWGGGTAWYEMPCTTPGPSPTWATAPPGVCGSQSIPVRAAGTWAISGSGERCRLMILAGAPANPVSFSLSGTVTLTVGSGSGTSEIRDHIRVCTWAVNAADAQVGGGCETPLTNGAAGGAKAFAGLQTTLFQAASECNQAGTAKCVVDIVMYKCGWPFSAPTMSYTAGPSGGCYSAPVSDTWTATLTIGGAAPTPAPSSSCDPAVPDWYCSPPEWWGQWTVPPDYPTPGPGGGLGVQSVDICQPGTISSTRSACATWPPSPAPDGGGGFDICDTSYSASQSLVCASTAPDYSPGPLETAFDGGGALPGTMAALDGIEATMVDKAPFGWALDVAAAMAPDGLAGGPIDWCFSGLPDYLGDFCLDPEAVATAATPMRPILFGIEAFIAAWWIGRRVWASVGGTGAE